jgi:uncharacterized protein YecE (DUF72 family)
LTATRRLSIPPRLHLGCAGWALPRAHAASFPSSGSQLHRYAQVLNAVELNSTFRRSHRTATFARWAESVPESFRFSVKLPQAISHADRFDDTQRALGAFVEQVRPLGARLGPLLVQLPPKRAFDESVVRGLVTPIRRGFDGPICIEPRHASWFVPEVENLLARLRIARVAADPVRAPGADRPGGSTDLVYFRLHGAPEIYRSSYSEASLAELAATIDASLATGALVWCIFDNTTLGAAAGNALDVARLLQR